jgi:D-alanyl-D-alanine carboxypeptidase
MNYLERIPAPTSAIVNLGLTSPSEAFMLGILPDPRSDYTGDCQQPTNPLFQRLAETRSVGPFRATGIRPALDSLAGVMAAVKAELPDLHDKLGSAGMLCCRFRKVNGRIVRKRSNHSFGTAIDIKIDNHLDHQGDGFALRGLLILAKYFNAAGWYWGATFPTEDAMHFEASKELLQRWKRAALI